MYVCMYVGVFLVYVADDRSRLLENGKAGVVIYVLCDC